MAIHGLPPGWREGVLKVCLPKRHGDRPLSNLLPVSLAVPSAFIRNASASFRRSTMRQVLDTSKNKALLFVHASMVTYCDVVYSTEPQELHGRYCDLVYSTEPKELHRTLL